MIKNLLCFIAILFICKNGFSQENINEASLQLEELSKIKTELNSDVRIDLSGLTLHDFITTLAEEHQLNVSVDSDLNQLVTSNFFDISVKDVFVFLIKKHQLEFNIENNILIFNKKLEPIVVQEIQPLKKIDVSFNQQNQFLSIRLKNDSLPRVAETIADLSGKNVILSPDIKNQKVSAYVLNRPFDQVMELLARSNNLALTVDENDNYFLDKNTAPIETSTGNNRRMPNNVRNNRNIRNNVPANENNGSLEIELSENGYLNIKAFEADASEMIIQAANQLNINFFMYNTPQGINTTLVANSISFDELLNHLFKGEIYTYNVIEDIYIIGEHITEGIRKTELVQLENRSIESVFNSLPSSLTQVMEIKEFVELNGFVVSGSSSYIQEFKDYIREIDRVVPVIQIEVIIVQYQKSYQIQTGMQAGLNDQQRTTEGVLFPTTDVSLNSSSVNSLIDAFNGLGFINLGKVTEQFYLNLSLLENNSLINVSSTPKLVTLNGHEASSSIGETNYYFEQNNQLITRGVNDGILQSGQWKPTEANLSINIIPSVSTDENVTLTISVEKSSFLGRAGENAPPGKATQKFESMIRVKNNEMILLGGLDELENENSGTGTPFISRIPILRWFFSGRTKRKDKSKLHIFIKPTVTY